MTSSTGLKKSLRLTSSMSIELNADMENFDCSRVVVVSADLKDR